MTAAKSMRAELEEKSKEFDLLRQQLSAIDDELNQLGERVQSFEAVKDSIDSIAKTKKGTELIVPLGEGLFIKSSISNVDNVLLGVGSGIVVAKTVADSQAYVEERIKEANTLMERLSENSAYFNERLRLLETELKSLVAKIKGE
jgi:prefoldin alpha subunit